MGDTFKKPLKALSFGILGSKLLPSAPKVQTPAEMPDPANQLAAKKRKTAEAAARSGRESTILSSGDRLGP